VIVSRPLPAEDQTPIPERILVRYNQDYNIAHLDAIIRRKLTVEQRQRALLLKRTLIQERENVRSPQTVLDRRISLDNIASYEAELDELNRGIRLSEYNSRSAPLLLVYKQIGPARITVSFDTGLVNVKSNEREQERHRVIAAYFDVAADYIQLEVVREIKMANVCSGCETPLDDVLIDEGGMQTCPGCRAERFINVMPTHISTRNDYQDRTNFLKAFRRYNGQQTDRTTPCLYRELDAYFIGRGRPSGAEIKKLPLDEWGWRGDTDLVMLFAALQAINRPDFYEDGNIIGHKYWGWTLPNASHLEEIILSDYDKTQPTYNALPKERSSSMPTQFRLFKHLQMRKHRCRIEGFKLAGQRESLEFCEAAWKEMCERAGDPEIYYIPTL